MVLIFFDNSYLITLIVFSFQKFSLISLFHQLYGGYWLPHHIRVGADLTPTSNQQFSSQNGLFKAQITQNLISKNFCFHKNVEKIIFGPFLVSEVRFSKVIRSDPRPLTLCKDSKSIKSRLAAQKGSKMWLWQYTEQYENCRKLNFEWFLPKKSMFWWTLASLGLVIRSDPHPK